MYVGLDFSKLSNVLSYCYDKDEETKVLYFDNCYIPNKNLHLDLYPYTIEENKEKAEKIGRDIKEIIDWLCTQENVEISTISYLVITIPQEWLKKKSLQKHILQICQNIFHCEIHIIGNIRALVAYFQSKYNQTYSKYFVGYLFIYHLEDSKIHLIKLNRLNIKIIQSIELRTLYINDIFGGMINNLDLNEKEFEKYLFDFEYKKNLQSRKVNICIRKYLKNNQRNQPIFYIGQYPCRPSHLHNGFNKNLAFTISSKIQEIRNNINQHNVDLEQEELFQILSIKNKNDYLIEQNIINNFDNNTKLMFKIADEEPDALKAKGALFIAKQMKHTAPANIGLVSYIVDKYGEYIEHDKVFIEKGTPINECSVPDYENGFVHEAIMHDDLKTKLKVFIETKADKLYFKLPEIKKYFPNPKLGNQWHITFYIDKNKRYYISIRDKNGNCINLEMQKLLSQVNQ